ncbi:IQ domain-containing protein M isoform X2 [Eptesicus fuscus]|nr:IQ domain-containing protein M isoform X2 [Eptesicus fuscus]XP_054573670.1 IQ domain-containing protein M isoform X2 [Eptesicus fuscus]
MADAETVPGSVLEISNQDFFQEAKTLIAQHYEKINENKVQGTSINVFRNKHQKPRPGKYIPSKIKKDEIFDVVQELQIAHKHVYFHKDVSKGECFEEPPQRTSFKESHMFHVKEKIKGYVDLIAKEQVQLGKIVTNIESVGKKMEKEKQKYYGKSRMLDSYTFPIIKLGLSSALRARSSTWLPKDSEKALCDWRGIVSIKSSRLAPDSSLPSDSEYSTKSFLKKEPIFLKPEPASPPRVPSSLSKTSKLDSKVKRIGPHIEIFQVFRERTRSIITKKTIRMITIMQAYVRGWLERRRYHRILNKALNHGPSLRAVINMYHRLIHRVKYRLGLWRTRQIINYSELEEWMDRKKFYETMFAKRQDWQGLERSELLKFFNDCGHYPTLQQIDQVWDLVHRDDREKYSEIVKKSNAVEMLFTLYPPQGAHVKDNRRLKSTWLRPMVNGEEGYKYIVSGHPILKRADIRIVGKLVCASMRERKMRQQYLS